MRRTRKLVLGTAMTLAVLALAAPAVNATEPIEIIEAPAGSHCPALPTGCTLHAIGEATLRTHFFGVEAQEARCRVELVSKTDEDGNGAVNTVNITNGAHGESNCPTVSPPCTSSLPWPVTTEENAPGTVELHADVCIDPSEFLTCEGEFDTVATEETLAGNVETQHVSVTDNRIGTAFCEIDLSGELETGGAGDAVHIRHGGDGGGGGSGVSGVSVTPSSQIFTNLSDYKSFTIKNVGTTTWVINNWTHPAGFTTNDPSGCLWKVYAANQSCTLSIRPTGYGASGVFSVSTSAGISGISFLDGPDAPGTWGVSITPASQVFANLNDYKPFTIKNTGLGTWTITTRSLPIGFTYSDPNGCMNIGRSYAAGQACTLSFKPSVYLAADHFQISTSAGIGAATWLDGPDSRPVEPYVAFGDSYSAGTGTNQNSYANACRQTNYAYPRLISNSRANTPLTFMACHGAITTNVTQDQIPLANLSSNTKWVTITIGGNDVEFEEVMKICAKPNNEADCLAQVQVSRGRIQYGLRERLLGVYSLIRDKAPNATVIVLGYPRIFYSGDCDMLTFFTPTEVSQINYSALMLRDVIQGAVATAGPGFIFKDAIPIFNPHGVCSSDPWLTNVVTLDIGDSFHPNRNGHNFGYSVLVMQAMH